MTAAGIAHGGPHWLAYWGSHRLAHRGPYGSTDWRTHWLAYGSSHGKPPCFASS